VAAMTSGTLTESLRETLSLFEVAGEPRTTTEVAARLDLGRRSTYERLERLVDHDRIATKKVGANARVWWRPADASPAGDPDDGAVTESSLREESAHLARVLEASPIGIAIFDADGTLVQANDRFSTLLGRDPDAQGTYSLGDATPVGPDGTPIPFEDRPVRSALVTGDAVDDHRLRIENADGSSRWLSVNAYPFAASGGGAVATLVDVTDLVEGARRVERERDDLESELEETFERIDDGFVALDADHRFTYVNERAQALLDEPRADLLGDHLWDVLPYEEAWDDALDRAMVTQEPVHLEHYVESIDTWFEYHVHPSPTGLSVYFRDVTERVERERELQRYAGIIDAVGEPVYEVDAAGTITFVNEPFVDYSGYAADELLGSHVSMGMDESAIERVEARMVDLALSGGSGNAQLEYEVITKSGDRIPAENRFTLLTDDDGEIRGSAGVLWDVSDRRDRQQALAESMRRYRTLVDNFPNGAVVLFDADLTVLTAGGTLFDGLDLTPADLEGAAITDRLPSTIAEAVDQPYRAVFDGEASEFDLEFDGEVRSIRVLPVTDEDGQVFAGMAMSQDVTERIQRERERERQREQLAALNNLNDIVREITDVVIDRSTRVEIEATVCERLAASDSYRYAWIGDVDAASRTVAVRAAAGCTSAIEERTVSVDPADPRSDCPTAEALRTGEVRTVQHVPTDPRFEQWWDHAESAGIGSIAAIPVVYEGTTYGVLTVASPREGAFEGPERDVLGQLGEVVAHAIAAADRKRALMSDQVVELQFHVPGLLGDREVPDGGAGRVVLEHTVPVGDDEYLVYGRAQPDADETLRTLVDAMPDWGDLTVREVGRELGFEVHLATSPLLSTLASLGGSVEEAVVEGGALLFTLHLPPGGDVRQVIETVSDVYAGAELLKQRQVSGRDDADARVGAALTADLTDRQLTVLEAAYYAGFFEWPRGATGEDVADSLGIAAPTFHQHLRKAEGALVDAVLGASRTD